MDSQSLTVVRKYFGENSPDVSIACPTCGWCGRVRDTDARCKNPEQPPQLICPKISCKTVIIDATPYRYY